MRRLPCLLLLFPFAMSAPLAADQLTIERILGSPALSGDLPRGIALSPDGSRVSFLLPRADDANRLDLWALDLETGSRAMLVDSELLDPEDAELSAEETARRERKRIPGTRGIVEVEWAPDGRRLAFPLGGDVFLVDLDASGPAAVSAIETSDEFATDVRFSPQGTYLSFVRGQDLWAVELASGREIALTSDGDGPIKNGMAEFVAQEEMDRYTGYWWAPDESSVAVIRVDESPVEIARRHEIFADRVDVVEQRYPWAGTPNVDWSLRLVDPATGAVRAVELGDVADTYLYRAAWFPDSRRLALQIQPRSQRRLDLVAVDAVEGSARTLLTERSATWIELQNDLTFLQDGSFVWSSRRDGFQHLYLHGPDGASIRRLTAGEWEVATGPGEGGVLGVDEERRLVYFMATADGPLERHLYRQSLDTGDPTAVERVTHGPGVHAVKLGPGAQVFVDTFESPTQPPQVAVRRIDGDLVAWLAENVLGPDHPYHPYLESHPVPEFGTLEAEDGQRLHTRLYRPAAPAGARLPVLVWVYGGPRGQQVTRSWGGAMDQWLRWISRRGIAVFTLDNRGTGFRGAAFDDPLHLRLGDVEVRDQLVGVRWLREQPWVDPERIAVFGWSYGGYMSLRMLSEAPGIFAAGVSGAPVTDWRLYDTHYTERFLDRPQENAAGYEASSVFPALGALVDPLLVVHGMADDNVLFTNATRVFQALQDAGRPFEMMTYPGAKHSLCRVSGTGEHCLATVTRFLERHLRPAAPQGGP